jgi:hypothetical protein
MDQFYKELAVELSDFHGEAPPLYNKHPHDEDKKTR